MTDVSGNDTSRVSNRILAVRVLFEDILIGNDVGVTTPNLIRVVAQRVDDVDACNLAWLHKNLEDVLIVVRRESSFRVVIGHFYRHLDGDVVRADERVVERLEHGEFASLVIMHGEGWQTYDNYGLIVATRVW